MLRRRSLRSSSGTAPITCFSRSFTGPPVSQSAHKNVSQTLRPCPFSVHFPDIPAQRAEGVSLPEAKSERKADFLWTRLFPPDTLPAFPRATR
ncbi:MAG: hypothetical protein Kow0054_17080 [Deferrisoma sp.]